MRYWWVNHSQTFKQEIAGQFLWSPKTEKGGKRSQFYDNMRIASPGDLVLSYADAQISFVGGVLDFAMAAKKPQNYGAAGRNWEDDGWYLPVAWHPVRQPIRPVEFLDEIRPLFPSKYSPFDLKRRRGSQKGYLAEISRTLFERLVSLKAPAASLALEDTKASTTTFSAIAERLDELEVDRIAADSSLEPTERSQVVKARRGQGNFRSNVILIEKGCRVTGLDNHALLVASHIKPWRSCSSSSERLDGANGLLLAAHVDLLFDRGFMSFRDNGDVLLSPRINFTDLAKLGLQELGQRNTGAFSMKQISYLEFHRSDVFLA